MRRLLIVFALIFAHTALAGHLEEGESAYERKDYTTALAKFRSAARQESAAAQYNLGVMYDEGRGVAQDYKKAVSWYRIAAQQGYASAQNNLGVMYSLGKGVLEDQTRAHMWFSIAAVNGNKNSVQGRYLVASLMTPQQLEKAQRMARECMASNYTKCD